MYRVIITYGEAETTIHDPMEGNACLSYCNVVEGESNQIESCSFEIFPNNPGYDQIFPRKTFVYIQDTDSEPARNIFTGRVLTVNPEMSEDGIIKKSVVCESRKGFLCDSVQPYVPEKTYTGGGDRNGLQEFIDIVLDNHNKQVEEYKRIYRGLVTVAPNGTGNVTKSLNYETTWEIITNKLIGSFGGEIQVYQGTDGLLYLDYVAELGEISDTEIKIGKNMKSISRQTDPSEIITRLIPLGAEQTDDDGNSIGRLTISSVNNGSIYIDDEVSIKVYGIVCGVVEWNDVTDPKNLKEKAQEWFEQQIAPESISLSALDLSRIGLDNDKISRFNYYKVINDYVGLNAYLRVVKTTLDVVNPTDFSVEMGALNKTMSAVLAETSNSGHKTATDTSALATQLQSVINSLTVAKATIYELKATVITTEQLEAEVAKIGYLKADEAEIRYAKITDLNAVNANIEILEADSANIKSLLAGNAGIGDLQSIHLTTANAVLDSALIRNAVIQAVTVNDLLAGTISTNKFVIASDDGGIRISGATQQWKDENGTVRVQIGKDAQGDFTFALFDETGTGVLIDSTGIKPGAIADGLIVNDMVAEDAAIAGSKLDIVSLFEEMNGSTEVLKSSRIWFDEQNQSLTQIYSQMSSNITYANNTAKTAQENAQKALEAVNGISTLEAISAVLSNDAHVVHTNTDGSGGVWTDCNTKVSVYSGDADVSDEATYTVYPSAGVTGTWNASTRTYQVTGMTTDDGYVDIEILYGTGDMYLTDHNGNKLTTRGGTYLTVRTGGARIRKRFSISKAPDGKIGVSYSLQCSSLAIRKQQDGTMVPASVTFSARYNDGTYLTDYAGRYKIEESTDGSTYTQKYMSAADELQKAYTPSGSGVKSIRCTLYAAGGGGELDSQSVIVITDADGLAEDIDEIREGMQSIRTDVTNIETGMDGIRANISSMQTDINGVTDGTLMYNVQYNDNGNNTVTLTAKVYKAGKDVTNTFSNRWFTWWAKSESGEKYIGYGYGITVRKSDVGFGSTYIGRFTTYETRYLTTRSGAYLTTRGGNRLTTWVEN